MSLVLNIVLMSLFAYLIYRYSSRLTSLFGKERNVKSGFGPYYDQRTGLFRILKHDTGDVLFVGHSIIDGCEWAELLHDSTVRNRGINGAIIEGLFGQIDLLSQPSPKKMFLMIGTNDIGKYENAEGISARLAEFVKLFRNRNPKTKIYLMGLLPMNRDMDQVTVKNASAYEKDLVKLAAGMHCRYIELASAFRDTDGYFDSVYTNDGWHLTGAGYEKMKAILQPFIAE